MLPLIVHWSLPPTVKLTGKPELAVALTLKSASPYVLLANTPNVIVWFAFVASTS